jgi:hypothetical protein
MIHNNISGLTSLSGLTSSQHLSNGVSSNLLGNMTSIVLHKADQPVSDFVISLETSNPESAFEWFLQYIGAQPVWQMIQHRVADRLNVYVHILTDAVPRMQNGRLHAGEIDLRQQFAQTTVSAPNVKSIHITGLTRNQMDLLWLQAIGEEGWLYHPMWYYHDSRKTWVTTAERSFAWIIRAPEQE